MSDIQIAQQAKMKPIIQIIILLFVFSITFSSCKQDAENERPNIILIMADDMGYECIGANGSTEYETPNLDRLAAEGSIPRADQHQPPARSRVAPLVLVAERRQQSLCVVAGEYAQLARPDHRAADGRDGIRVRPVVEVAARLVGGVEQLRRGLHSRAPAHPARFA